MITWDQVAGTLDKHILCEIGGGHRWDVEIERTWMKPVYWYPLTECLACGWLKENPHYDKERRKLDKAGPGVIH